MVATHCPEAIGTITSSPQGNEKDAPYRARIEANPSPEPGRHTEPLRPEYVTGERNSRTAKACTETIDRLLMVNHGREINRKRTAGGCRKKRRRVPRTTRGCPPARWRITHTAIATSRAATISYSVTRANHHLQHPQVLRHAAVLGANLVRAAEIGQRVPKSSHVDVTGTYAHEINVCPRSLHEGL